MNCPDAQRVRRRSRSMNDEAHAPTSQSDLIMPRTFTVRRAIALFAVVVAAPIAAAQRPLQFVVSGGAVVPTGGFKNSNDLGIHADGSFILNLPGFATDAAAASGTFTGTKFAIDGGAGLRVRMGAISGFIEGRINSVYTEQGMIDFKNVRVIPVSFGLAF